jgi:hypothetical protein
MFSFMLSHLLLCGSVEDRRGISDDGVSFHEIALMTGFEPALPPWLVVLIPLKYPLSFATGEWV